MAEFISKINLGGTVYNIKDASLAPAIQGIIDDASADFNTLGKIQKQIENNVADVRGTAAIDVTESDGAKIVAIRKSAAEGNIVEIKNDGLYVGAPDVAEYSVVKDASAGDYAAVYHLTKDGVAVGEAINIPKDYLVKSGSVVTGTWDGDVFTPGEGDDKAIEFVINAKEGEGTEEKIYINVKDLVDVYTAGAGVEISETNEVSAKVADATENAVDGIATGKNFLKINDSSALEVKGVDTDSTIFTDDITVAGGPLAGLTANWPTDWVDENGAPIIPGDKSVQEIFTGLFLKKVAGSLSAVTYSWAPAYANKPTASLGKTGDVEIGTELTVSAATVAGLKGNVSTASATANPGYYSGDTFVSGNYSQSVDGTCDDSSLAYTATFNGAAVENGDTVTVAAGTNTLSVSQSGSVASVEALTAETIYGAYNTKEKNESVSRSVTAKSYADKNVDASTNTATVTGKYKYFYGYHAWADDYAGLITKPGDLTSKSEAFLSTSYGATISKMTSTAAASALVVLIPSVAKISASKSPIGSDNLNTWNKVDSFDYTNGNTTTTYDVWVAHSKGSIVYQSVTIAKA